MNKYPPPTSMDQCCEVSLEDQRKSALKQYDEMASQANHWSSFIAQAIASYVPKRRSVYEAINTERDYQDSLPSYRTDKSKKSVGDYCTMLNYYNSKLTEAWTNNAGDSEALHVMRKIAGIAVHCMEDHGAFNRAPVSRVPTNDCVTNRLNVAEQLSTERSYAEKFVEPVNLCEQKSLLIEPKETTGNLNQKDYKCLKVISAEQAATNSALRELISICMQQIKQLIGNNPDLWSVNLSEDGDLDFLYEVDPVVFAQIKARISVIKELNKSIVE